jgi:hypothetical protein
MEPLARAQVSRIAILAFGQVTGVVERIVTYDMRTLEELFCGVVFDVRSPCIMLAPY